MDRAPPPRGPYQKYPPCPGGAGFVPSVDAVTSSQALQWLVQPRLLPPPPAGSPCGLPGPALPPYPRPGIIRPPAPGPPRRPSQQLAPEDEERRRLRRERNKLAAAKCRNRRKELTEALQQETARLEGERAALTRTVAELRRDKERLELALAAHGPVCTAPAPLGPAPGPRPRPPPLAPPPVPLEPEALHTPTLMATPSLTPFTPSLVFSYPAPGEAEPAAGPAPEPCGSAHRRESSSSSSGQSSSSLNSPTLLAL